MKLDEFIELFAGEFDETPADQFKSNTVYKDLEEWDSLSSLSVIAVIDEELQKRIVGADFRNSNTIEELFEIVQNK
jgi:acyl carrier protein